MRQVTFGPRAKFEEFERYVTRALQEIADASLIDALTISDRFRVKNFTPTTTLDMGTATATDIGNFLATFIDDLKRRGPNRQQ